MGAVGLFLMMIGYGVFYFGLDKVSGGNDSFESLLIPGHFTSTASKDTQPTTMSQAEAGLQGANSLASNILSSLSNLTGSSQPAGNPTASNGGLGGL